MPREQDLTLPPAEESALPCRTGLRVIVRAGVSPDVQICQIKQLLMQKALSVPALAVLRNHDPRCLRERVDFYRVRPARQEGSLSLSAERRDLFCPSVIFQIVLGLYLSETEINHTHISP